MFYLSLAAAGVVIIILYGALLMIVRWDQEANWNGLEENLDHLLRCEFLLLKNGRGKELSKLRTKRPVLSPRLKSLASDWLQEKLVFKGVLYVGGYGPTLATYGRELVSILEQDDPELSELLRELRAQSNFRMTPSAAPDADRLRERSWVLTKQGQATLNARIAELSGKANFEKPRGLEMYIARYSEVENGEG